MDVVRTIDEIDLAILSLLQDNARITNADIARQVEMAPSAVLERVRKLEDRGLIKGYFAQLDARALGFGLLAFVLVRTKNGSWGEETGSALAEIPEVEEVHHIAGEDCFLVKVRAADTEALGMLIRDTFQSIPAVQSTRTTVVLATVKETQTIPLRIGSVGVGKR